MPFDSVSTSDAISEAVRMSVFGRETVELVAGLKNLKISSYSYHFQIEMNS
jgi:hypothetical protein